VPELKRLHGFPADFDYEGSRREIQMQVGNAVPPLLAEVVARAVSWQTLNRGSAESLELVEARQLTFAVAAS
jgi:DNA (cytosine-5)-methyltransferase 1